MKRFLIAASLVIALCAGCESEKQTTIASQETAIENWITSKHSGKDVYRNGGSNRVVVILGERDSIAAGDIVTMSLDGYVFSSGPSTQFCSETVTTAVGSGNLVSGLDNGLIGAMAGEECYVVFNASYGFYDETIGAIPPMSALVYYIKVFDIEKQ